MRISIAFACVVVFAAFPLFSGRGAESSEERRIEDRLARARHKVDDMMLTSDDAKELVKKSRAYIARAETALANHHTAFAGPLSEAAEALSLAIDHVVRSRDVTLTDYPSRQRLSYRLDAVGMRVKQADYFQKLGGDSTARGLVGLARRYNDRAREAYHQGKRRETDEYATTADEIVRALEYIAQAHKFSGNGRPG